MPDLKISQLTQDTTPAGADFFEIIKSPFGAGSNRKMTITSFMQNQTISWKTTGGFSFGNLANLTFPGFPFSIYHEITDYSGTNQWGPFAYYPTHNPSVDITTKGITNFDFESISLVTNKNFGSLSNFYNYIELGGSGTCEEMICAQYGAIITGTRSADEVYCLTMQSGHFGTAGDITLDKTLDLSSPAHGNGGTMTTHIGINVNDQEFGTNSWAIITKGGKVQFGAPSGKNSVQYMQDDDVAHGMTSLYPTDVYGVITSVTATTGGLSLTGLSDTDAGAFSFNGIIGSSSPSATTPAFSFRGFKKSGTTDQALGATDLNFGIFNANSITASVSILGSGFVGILNNAPSVALDVTGAGKFSGILTANGTITSPGAGGGSERFGASSLAGGSASVALGNGASAADSNVIAIGFSSIAGSGATNTIVIGSGISTSSADGVTIGNGASNWKQSVGIGSSVNAGGQDSVSVGYQGGGGTQTVMLGSKAGGSGTNNIGIGYNISVTGSGGATDSIGIGANAVTGFTNVIAIGSSAIATAANQALIGGASTSITSVYFGKGVTSAIPLAVTLSATGGSTTGVNGANFILAGGIGGGAADKGGDILLKTATTGSGTTLATMFQISENKIGFFNATTVVKQTSGANLTNNVTAGGTTDQIDDFTNLTVYATDAATIRNDIYQLAKKLKQINDGLRSYGLFT